jgi:Lamin Tail Domain
MKRLGLISVFVLLLVVSPVGVVDAAVKIKRIRFDPPGPDGGSNQHLNREYIFLVNTGPDAVQLRDWKVADRGRNHRYRFSSLYLEPNDTIHLRTGHGSDGAPVCEAGTPCPDHARYDFHWGLENPVWNNSADRARLIRPNGNVADRCSYSASDSSPVRC